MSDRSTAARAVSAVARLMTLLLVTSLTAVAGPAARACACGGVVSHPGDTTKVTGESALLSRTDGRETVVMSLDARSAATEAGLVVPTPKPAEVALDDPELFEDLRAQAAPRVVTEHHLLGPAAFVRFGANSAGAPGRTDSGVQVLDEVDLGPLRAVTLRAGDAGALQRWLSAHDFRMSARFGAAVEPYVDDGWAFTAVSLTAQGRSLGGTLPPLRLAFDSDRLVYPMRMSRAAQESQSVRTYVLADRRMQRTDTSADSGSTPTTVYAAPLQTSLLDSDTLRELAGDHPWLTVIDQYFDDPATQITADFTFAPSATQDEVVRYVTDDVYLLPWDLALLLVLVLAAAAVGTVVLIGAVRARRAPA